MTTNLGVQQCETEQAGHKQTKPEKLGSANCSLLWEFSRQSWSYAGEKKIKIKDLKNCGAPGWISSKLRTPNTSPAVKQARYSRSGKAAVPPASP